MRIIIHIIRPIPAGHASTAIVRNTCCIRACPPSRSGIRTRMRVCQTTVSTIFVRKQEMFVVQLLPVGEVLAKCLVSWPLAR